MKKVKIIVGCVLFFTAFVFIGEVLQYILVDDTNSYTRITFHEMYDQDNIDILFVGSSHCYRSFIPEILDNNVGGLNTFNAGTSSQALDGSYIIIQEAAKRNDLQRIYLELYFNVGFSSYKDRGQLTQTYIISDYLPFSMNRVCYLLNASQKKHYINSFIIARRSWEKIWDMEYIKNLINKKQTDIYREYGYEYVIGDTEWYAGKGFVANNASIREWNIFMSAGWEKIPFTQITEDWMESLNDIIEFCSKKDIPLTLISAPMSNYYLASAGNYDEYVTLVNEIIKDTNVEYIDFNLCREEYIPNRSELFKDIDHLNYEGAKMFSSVFLDYLNGDVSEKELLYTSYKEKLENLEPTVFGIGYHDESRVNGETVRKCKIISSREGIEYSIQLDYVEGESVAVQNYSGNKEFTILPDDHGVCTIQYRLQENKEEEHVVSIRF